MFYIARSGVSKGMNSCGRDRGGLTCNWWPYSWEALVTLRAFLVHGFPHTLRPMLRRLRRVRIIVDMVAVAVLRMQWRRVWLSLSRLKQAEAGAVVGESAEVTRWDLRASFEEETDNNREIFCWTSSSDDSTTCIALLEAGVFWYCSTPAIHKVQARSKEILEHI